MNSQTATRKHHANETGSIRWIHERVERLFANRDYASKHHVQLRTTLNDDDDHVAESTTRYPRWSLKSGLHDGAEIRDLIQLDVQHLIELGLTMPNYYQGCLIWFTLSSDPLLFLECVELLAYLSGLRTSIFPCKVQVKDKNTPLGVVLVRQRVTLSPLKAYNITLPRG